MSKFFAFAAILFFTIGRVDAEINVELCNTCYSPGQFAHAAEQYSLSTLPGFIGIDPVYVVNPDSESVRFYHVHRSQDWSFDPLGVPSEDRGTLATTSSGFFVAEAVEVIGDPGVLHEISNALTAYNAFLVEIYSSLVLNAEDLPDLPNNDVISAVSLVGDGPGPAFRRTVTRNAISNRINDLAVTSVLNLADTARGVFDRLVGSGELVSGFSIILRFADGTQIPMKIEIRMVVGLENHVVVELDPTEAQGPGLIAVPQSPGEFVDFTFKGHDITLNELAALAQMYGIPVTGPSGGGGNVACRFECDIQGDHLECRTVCSTY